MPNETNTVESAPLLGSPVSYGTQDNGAAAAPTVTTSTEGLTPRHHLIGIWGSMAIAVNSLTGPAMLDLPATFQRSGIIPTILTLIFVCLLTSLCALHMADVISKVPGNSSFQKEMEFSECFRYFWGHRWFVVTHIIFFGCVSCLNISSIVDNSQVVDTFLGHWHGRSGALLLSPRALPQWVTWDPIADCTHHNLKRGRCLAFASYEGQGLLITAGYLITALVFFPLSLMDLKENSAFQIAGFLVLLVTSLQFVVEFALQGFDLDHNLSWWGTSWDTLFGVVLFNFALVICLPAWLYERHPSVSVPGVIYGSCILSTVLYIFVGLFGALSIHHVSDNMLESLMSGALFGTSMQLGASAFAFMIVGLGIPLFSVLTRMNLVGSGLVGPKAGNLLAVYFPWGISWMLYQGRAVTTLLSWGGVLFTAAVAFLLPLVLALHAVQEHGHLKGSISVYKGSGSLFSSRRSQVAALSVLIALAVLAVALALAGQFYVEREEEEGGAAAASAADAANETGAAGTTATTASMETSN